MSKNEVQKDNEKTFKCSIEYTQSKIGGKWKLVILWHLGHEGVHRYNELQSLMPAITHKVLSQKLKQLEADGLVRREQYNEMPPRVEYSLTVKGKTVMPILDAMHVWGNTNW